MAALLLTAGPCQATEATSVLVQGAPAVRQTVDETMQAYGKVGFDDAWLSNINAAHAGQVMHLAVMPGQLVQKDEVLAQISTSPSGLRAYRQAVNARNYAKSELKRLQDLYAQQFATQAQITTAKKNLADAENQVTQMEQQGVNNALDIIKAPFGGIVSSVAVQRGQRIGAGSTLLILGRSDRLKAIVGLEPEDSKRIHQNMAVHIASVFDATVNADSRIASVHRVIDPKTRLVDAVVLLQGPQTRDFLPGMQVAAVITVRSVPDALTVPNTAILHDTEGSYVFVIHDGQARRVDVHIVLAGNTNTAIGGSLQAGDRVVISGNYELSDGMRVRESHP
jgi:RND family efflux transporter MFP subunit